MLLRFFICSITRNCVTFCSMFPWIITSVIPIPATISLFLKLNLAYIFPERVLGSIYVCMHICMCYFFLSLFAILGFSYLLDRQLKPNSYHLNQTPIHFCFSYFSDGIPSSMLCVILFFFFFLNCLLVKSLIPSSK